MRKKYEVDITNNLILEYFKMKELNKITQNHQIEFFLMGITLNSIVIDILLLYQRATSLRMWS